MITNLRFARAFLTQPPTKIFFLWGDIPADLSDWIQPPELWRIVLYGHEGVARQNARRVEYSPNTGMMFAPGSRGGHIKIGSSTPIVTAQFDLPTSGNRQIALPTIFQVSREDYDALIFAGERGTDSAERGRAFVWNLLWTISQPASVIRDQDAIYVAEDFIRTHMAMPLIVSDIAAELEISSRTLLSWFQAEHGTTVKGFMRQTRAREACRLLVETNQSVKSIAASVGVSNLQQFNKLVRSHVGLSPRVYRSRSN